MAGPASSCSESSSSLRNQGRENQFVDINQILTKDRGRVSSIWPHLGRFSSDMSYGFWRVTLIGLLEENMKMLIFE